MTATTPPRPYSESPPAPLRAAWAPMPIALGSTAPAVRLTAARRHRPLPALRLRRWLRRCPWSRRRRRPSHFPHLPAGRRRGLVISSCSSAVGDAVLAHNPRQWCRHRCAKPARNIPCWCAAAAAAVQVALLTPPSACPSSSVVTTPSRPGGAASDSFRAGGGQLNSAEHSFAGLAAASVSSVVDGATTAPDVSQPTWRTRRDVYSRSPLSGASR